jgi:primase-polymerase (primpol)-like protein
MSLSINPSSIPVALRERPQWVLWRIENRGGAPTKIPYSTDGPPARSNDPATWAPFDVVLDVFERGGTQYSGIGYVFSESDEFCGIDLDGCRDPETNEWSDWARAIIADLDSYTELSPSGSGAKIFIRGKCPLASGKNTRLPRVTSRGGKQAGIEVYDKLRYFAVTGQRLRGAQPEPMERQSVLERLCSRWFGAGDGGEEDAGGGAVNTDAAASGLSRPSAPAPRPPPPPATQSRGPRATSPACPFRSAATADTTRPSTSRARSCSASVSRRRRRSA